MRVEQRMADMGLKLEVLTKPMGNYVQAVEAGGLVFSSGASCTVDGVPKYKGIIGADLTIEEGYDAARLAAIMVLAKIKSVIDDLDRIDRFVKVVAHMRTAPNFEDHALITNGASDLFVKLFGSAGEHARLSLGSATLPAGLPLEIEVIAALKPA